MKEIWIHSLALLAAACILSGCVANRSVEYDSGAAQADNYVAASIPSRPAGVEKIPVGVILAIKNEDIERYPQLKENNIGLGLKSLVNEQMLDSDWFQICTVDTQVLKQMMNLQEYYYHGEIDEGKIHESAMPEYIVMVNITRVSQIGNESVRGGVKKFTGSCEVRVSYEVFPLLSEGSFNLLAVASGTGNVPVQDISSIFNGGQNFRSSAFGTATERAIHNGLPKLIEKLERVRK
ncbi:hypothetical protein JXA32_15115 [Candidatus Sumerlaeota bacterium]|nr:hypothetical protein [Candidatus Sumerlaeota bacterium]